MYIADSYVADKLFVRGNGAKIDSGNYLYTVSFLYTPLYLEYFFFVVKKKNKEI